jgi:amino acid adenylation domain-containing protein
MSAPETQLHGYILSPQQNHLYRLQGGLWDHPFITQASVTLAGPLKAQAFEAALQAVIRRHSILRTTFRQARDADLALQVFSTMPGGDWILERVDLTNLEPLGQLACLNNIWLAERRTIFDLETGPLVKFHLIALGAQSHVLLMTLPSLCADLATASILVRELAEAYAGIPEDPEEPPQYIQYSEYQDQLLKGEESQADRNYWSAQRASSSHTSLPFEDSSGNLKEFQLRTIAVPLAQKTGSLVRATDSVSLPSPESFFFACWLTLLRRLGDSLEIVSGVYSSGRSFEELEGMPGLFARCLPVRISIGDKDNFFDVWARTEEQIAVVRDHQEGFSDDLAGMGEDELSVQSWQRNVYEYSAIPASIETEGLRFEIDRIFSCADRFRLRLSCFCAQDSVKLELDYDPSVCSDDWIDLVAGYLSVLVNAAAEAPQSPIADLPLMGTDLRRRALLEWNDTDDDLIEGRPLIEVFADRCRQEPEACAVECGELRLTYADLAGRSAQLARVLRDRGVGPEVVVGVSSEPTVETLVGILGVLRAGGAFLPLDLNYPAERLHFMVEDAKVKLVVVGPEARLNLPGCDVETLQIDTAEPETDAGLEPDPPGISPENAAYVIYTSGSTGRPKGTVITHAGLTNYLNWCLKAYAAPEGSGAPLHSSLSFDLSITSLFGPLAMGRRIVLLEGGSRVEGLAALLRQPIDLSWVKLTPSHARLLARQLGEAGAGGELRGRIRKLILGGEGLNGKDLRFWRENSPETMIINEYGPTEATVGCCVHQVSPNIHEPDSVPIGRPIGNTRIYILDHNLEPAAPGVAGEIFIGGIGLARGYLARPGLTAERFIPNPWESGASGSRLYRTGDLGRYRPDGSIEFLGRTDHQVKVRGYRIELGEIETILNQHPMVREAAVKVRRDDDEDRTLVAYVVPGATGAEAKPPTVAELRIFLESRMPDFMVPGMYVLVDALPLTESGKLDRAALPDPAQAENRSKAGFALPRTLEEEVLAAIWSNVLGLERVGIDDGYFLSGGDSIRAIQIVGQAAGRGLEFSLEDLFRRQTIRELAHAIRTANIRRPQELQTEPFALISEEDRRKLPPDIEDAYPLSRLQAGMIFHRQYHPESAIYHDIFGYHIRMPIDLERLDAAARQVVARHPALRTSFHLSGFSEPLQLVQRTAPSPLHVTDISQLAPDEQEKAIRAWMEEEKRVGFDYSSPPLVKYQVHLRSAETLQFSLSFHHAVIDGWSDATMLVQLAVGYYYLMAGRTPPFETPATSYRDFIALEQQAVESEEHRRFWLGRMSGAAPLVLPRWLPTPVVSALTRGVYLEPVGIAPEASDGLQRLARSLAVPLKNVLLAAHLRVMSALGGARDVLTTISSSGRPETLDGDKVLGLHLNSAPYRLELTGGTWVELIQQAFEAERDALPYRRFPLIEVQKMLGSRRISETSFYYTHYHIANRLEEFPDFEVLGRLVYEETSFALVSNFSLDPWNSQVTLALACDRTQFGDVQMKAMAGYFERALRAIAFSPESSYEELDLLSQEEKSQILTGFNQTTQPAIDDSSTDDRSVVSLIERQAAATPNEVAVRCGAEILAYYDLNRRANQLAHHLRRLGVGPEAVVALFFERSAEMIVALLGVLKAGAAYLPLDPEHPERRRQLMLDDSGVKIILSQERMVSDPAGRPSRVICLDRDAETLAAEPETDPIGNIDGDNPAYVIYTSGSTGRPKGALISHRNLLASTMARFQVYEEPPRSFLLLPSYAFDSSVAGIFWTLATGGTLVVAPPGVQRDPEAIVDLISEASVSHLLCLPSLYDAILDEARTRSLQSLRVAIVAGEPCPAALPAKHAAIVPGAALFNEYGPTESTVWSSVHRCENDLLEDAPDRSIPIGRPIPGTRLYVLDHCQAPAPMGVPGELYLGGVGVTRGYPAHPGLTAERFIPDPFSLAPDARVYRTGDRVRYRPDGVLEFLGRMDQQVKIRGYRIELSEIENVLLQRPEVAEAAVVAHGDEAGDVRLIAYLVCPGSRPQTVADLREWLKEQLPEYMAPSTFMLLESLPRNPNGKIDRQGLPAPDATSILREKSPVPPRDEKERLLADIWSAVLRVESIGIFDDFFELGGDSILSIRIVARARETGLKITPNQLFDSRTIAALAAAADPVQAINGAAVVDTSSSASETGLSDEEMEQFLDKLEQGATSTD